MSRYTNNPLDSPAQFLRIMVQYNAIFSPLYEPDFETDFKRTPNLSTDERRGQLILACSGLPKTN